MGSSWIKFGSCCAQVGVELGPRWFCRGKLVPLRGMIGNLRWLSSGMELIKRSAHARGMLGEFELGAKGEYSLRKG